MRINDVQRVLAISLRDEGNLNLNLARTSTWSNNLLFL